MQKYTILKYFLFFFIIIIFWVTLVTVIKFQVTKKWYVGYCWVNQCCEGRTTALKLLNMKIKQLIIHFVANNLTKRKQVRGQTVSVHAWNLNLAFLSLNLTFCCVLSTEGHCWSTLCSCRITVCCRGTVHLHQHSHHLQSRQHQDHYHH